MATGLVSGADGKVNLDPSWTKGTIRIVETKVPAGYTQGEESEKTAKLEDGSTTFVNPREDDSTTSGGTKTGDGSKLTLYILTGGVAAAIFAFLAFKKKKVRAGIISMMLIGVFAIGSVYAADGFVINKIDDNGDPVREYARKILYEQIGEMLGTLPERERQIIILRFGLCGQPRQPLVEISRRLNLTRERVRQLEQKILGKLRSPARLKFIDNCMQ